MKRTVLVWYVSFVGDCAGGDVGDFGADHCSDCFASLHIDARFAKFNRANAYVGLSLDRSERLLAFIPTIV